jgi:hypothetical protein
MNNKDYKLSRAAGLHVFDSGSAICIPAADVEKLLASAPKLTLRYDAGATPQWESVQPAFAEATHTARLLLIEPLKQDSAEDLLREFLDLYPEDVLHKRARKLLAAKEPAPVEDYNSAHGHPPAKLKCTCTPQEKAMRYGVHMTRCPLAEEKCTCGARYTEYCAPGCPVVRE